MNAPPELSAKINAQTIDAEAPHDVISHAEIAHAKADGPLQLAKRTLAFAFSALLSPYLVIPAGTVGIVATVSSSRADFLRWTAISIFFSTALPAIYVLIQIARGKITDVHVMEREQRGGPFTVALISSVFGALVLRWLKAPVEIWGIGLVLFVNGLVILQINKHWKISVHVAVLSATILAAIVMIKGVSPFSLAWMIPALIWARVTRGRHTIWQGLAACALACAITATVLYFILFLPRSIYAQ